jgi:hypothetical protein
VRAVMQYNFLGGQATISIDGDESAPDNVKSRKLSCSYSFFLAALPGETDSKLMQTPETNIFRSGMQGMKCLAYRFTFSFGPIIREVVLIYDSRQLKSRCSSSQIRPISASHQHSDFTKPHKLLSDSVLCPKWGSAPMTAGNSTWGHLSPAPVSIPQPRSTSCQRCTMEIV